jgi:CheY-like chemotaxis protein
MRLVIADDSNAMRSLIREALAGDFHEVIEAEDGRDLFWTLLRENFAAPPGAVPRPVVVTDLCMPGYNGLEVIEAWRELQPNTPVILITAFPSDTVRERAARLGAVMLAKPFSTQALRTLVREITDARPC